MRRLLVAVVLVLLVVPGTALAGGNNGKIAFVSKQNGGDEDIWLINPDGTGAADISQNLTRDVDPAFSPDGSKIAFARFISDRNFDLFVMNSDGTGERQITSTTASERFPSWSPDGKHLVYRKNVRNGKFDIWTLALGPTGPGTAAVNIVRDSPENDYDPEWSPDGTSIVVRLGTLRCPEPGDHGREQRRHGRPAADEQRRRSTSSHPGCPTPRPSSSRPCARGTRRSTGCGPTARARCG